MSAELALGRIAGDQAEPRSIVLVGPTASGKSDVAMALAGSVGAAPPVEIVAVDSMQVYRGMDIGTAKPTPADRAEVVHHCLDLADPHEDYTVADFARAAHAAIDDIDARQHRAVVVAGTGLYLRSITDPMEIPGRWPEVRVELESRLDKVGSEALHRQLSELDPLAASRIDSGNSRRIVRALEVVLGGGKRFSDYGAGLGVHPPTPFVQIGLQWTRPALSDRIAERVHRMIDAGLVAEVQSLLDRPSGWSRTARQALGYKEIAAHLEGAISLDQAVNDTIIRTRQFAVRQERWFRRDPRIRWVQITADPVAEVLPIVHRT
ncbi:MAG: tRNA (adenosine(37)-N6)-dimethylallyltransferase MiaA [Ilumatobacteraceae bacterium]